MGRRRRSWNRRDALLSTAVGEFENFGLMRLLFETPSGFAIFSTSEYYLNFPGIVENVWAKFRSARTARKVVFLRQFQTFEDKSAAINADTGVNQQLADMIEHWHLPGMKLGVAKPEYKTIIESKLGITCMHNEAVMEVMWGIEQLMHILVPDEKAELTKEDRLPMSQGLQMLLSRYGFDVELEMINKRIIVTTQTLCACEAVEFLRPLRNDALFLKAISGINCEHWDALKLATALMMLSSHREEIDSHEVLTQDELSKLKIEAHKYKDIVFKCNRLMYKELASAYKIKLAKKKLLGSLVKKARKAEVRKKGKLQGDSESQQIRQEHVQGELQGDSEQLPQEHVKGKLQGDSEQIPQEHVIFANLCTVISTYKSSYVRELPLPKTKVLKRSRDSFEPTEANKPIFSEGSEETPSRRIANRWRFSGAQPSVSKAIVPYMPLRHAPLLRIWAENQCQNMDADRNINAPIEQIEALGIKATPLALADDNGDEAITAELVVGHSEQNAVTLQPEEFQAHGHSGLPASARPPKSAVSLPTTPSVSNRSTPLVGKVVRRSPRLNQNIDCYQHVQLEDIPRKRSKKIVCRQSKCSA